MSSLGLVETAGIAGGVGLADAMVKKASVALVHASTICNGRYMIQVSGDREAVRSSMSVVGEATVKVVASHLISRVSDEVLAALRGTVPVRTDLAVSVVESRTAISGIFAADAAVKAAAVTLSRLVTGHGILGKSYFVLSGDVASVEAATAASAEILEKNLIDTVILAAPDQAVLNALTRVLR